MNECHIIGFTVLTRLRYQINMVHATNIQVMEHVTNTRLLNIGEYARNENSIGEHLELCCG